MQAPIEKVIEASSLLDLQLKALEMRKKQEEDDKRFWDGVSEKLQFLHNAIGPANDVSSQIAEISQSLSSIFTDVQNLNSYAQDLHQTLQLSKLKMQDAARQKQKVQQVIQFSTLCDRFATLSCSGQIAELNKIKDILPIINSDEQQQLIPEKDVKKFTNALYEAVITQINLFVYQRDINLHYVEYFVKIGMSEKQIAYLVAQYLTHILESPKIDPQQMMEILQQIEKSVNTKLLLKYSKLDTVIHDFLKNNQQKMDIIFLAQLYKIFNGVEYQQFQCDDLFIKKIQQQLQDEIFAKCEETIDSCKTMQLLEQILIQSTFNVNFQSANNHIQQLLADIDIKTPHKIRFANSLLDISPFSQEEVTKIINVIQTISDETVHTLNLYTQGNFAAQEDFIYEPLMQWLCRCISTNVRKNPIFEQSPIMSRLYAVEFVSLYKPNKKFVINEQRAIIQQFIQTQMKQKDINSLLYAISKLYLILTFKNKDLSTKQAVKEALEAQGYNFRTWVLQDVIFTEQFKRLFNKDQLELQQFVHQQQQIHKITQEVVQSTLDQIFEHEYEVTYNEVVDLIKMQIMLQQLNVLLDISAHVTQKYNFESVYQIFKQQ